MTSKSSSITIRDVAKKAGVSVATVSRYINHNQPVAPDTAERLDRVLKELNYVPHATARNLATRKTRIIGLLLADIRADFYAPLLRGIDAVEERARRQNLDVADVGLEQIAIPRDERPRPTTARA